MVSLPGVTTRAKIYESTSSLVYRGVREQDSLPIILKVLKQDYPTPAELIRYRQEYEVTRSLNLEGVIKVYNQQDYQRTLVMMLEDFGGESLEKWMQDSPQMYCPIPLPVFLRLAVKIAESLGNIHAANVIHKDINPSNIVLNPGTGQVKIIDFGIATRFTRTNPSFKSPHVLEGTLAYLSPEQTGRMNRLLDYRTDFYSLGVTFYELLTGHLPFPTTDMLELVHCHIARPPVPPDELNPIIPKAISDIVLKLMAKNAEARYQSAWGIKADLEGCARQLEAIGQVDSIQLGLQDVSEQFHIPQKLYGRETEVAALLAAFDRVAGSGNAENSPFNVEMMLVSGYAGIGKSALVQELYKPITAKRGYFISGKFDQFQRNSPYSAIVDALRKLVQQLLGEPNEQVQQWRSRLLSALGSNGQIIIDVIPEVELIIGKQPPVPEVGATEAQNRFNRIFQNFVRVFCSKEHPLVIFLDDLQWSDSATLKLIELLLLDEQTQYLFLIGAYRDNEVAPTHPLVLTLLELQKQGAVLQEIILKPLALESLNQLIAETLDCNTDTVRSLAQLVLRKTEGNPFFVGEFLRMLYSENLLTFDPPQSPLGKGGSKGGWQWDIAQIQARNITDNVVDLLLLQLKKLPEQTRQILRLAACVGSKFDLETLAIICERSPQAIFQGLLAAIQAELIQPLSELDENLLVQDYKFLHDRVQQAAYALIDESHKQVVHLQIGRNLLEKTSPEQRAERLFEIVDHLNRGIELESDQTERIEIAKLNLIAGQKAKAATAYEAALKYFKRGLKLLNTDSWQSEYDLTLALYSQAAGAAYLHGCFDEMEHFVEVVLNNAKTAIDKVQVYYSRIQGYLSQGNLKEAIKIGLEVLNLLGVILPENPSELDVRGELESTAALLAEREIEDLINLPEMTAPEPLAAMSTLANISGAAFITLPALFILITCKTVNLSINYGNAISSPLYYASYGFVLCGVVQDIELGYKFGQLALSLAERLNTKKGKAEALEAVGECVMQWKVHLKETIPLLVEAYQEGVEAGDFEIAGYAAYYGCYHSFLAGEELTQLEQKTATYSKALEQIRRESPSNWLAILRQTILNLQDRTENSSRLVSRLHNEKQALSHAIAVKDGAAIQILYLHKVILFYLFGEHHQAEQTAILARQHFEEVTAITVLPIFCFYHSLALLSLSPDTSNSEKAAWLSCVSSNQEKMQKWASYAPMNYLHKFYLVEAEKARVLGQFLEAEELYERAIAGAAENKFIQEEALAYELAAKHYLTRGREKFAQTYMKEAHYCYDRWGATAKVKDLEKRYPQLLNTNLVRQSHSIVTNETIRHPTAAIDLAAVMKAAQALSEIIHLDRLIATLMQVVIENAGAETGALVLLEDGQLIVSAQCSGSRHCDLEKIAVADCATIPVSVIHLVERTQETLVVDDAVSESSFSTDPYIKHHQTRSLLCMPILKQNQPIGILYLENNLSTGVFTSDRLQVLKLLMAQAVISLENARLYERLADYAETLERKVEKRTQALQQEIAERQQTEAALRQSEANYRNLLQTANSIIIRYDTQGRIRYINDYGVKLLGYEEHEIVGRTLFETIIPDIETSGRDVKPLVHDLLRNPQLYPQGEGENLCRDGRRVWIAWSNQAIFNDQGEVVEILSVGTDTTQRRQAEEALQRSEAKFRNIFENSQVGIFRNRISDGLILNANQRLANLLGFDSPEEIIGLEHSIDYFVNPSDREQAHELMKRDGELRSYEAQLRKRDGTVFWGLTSSYLNAADGYVEGVVADISDLKRAEVALQASEAELRALFSAIPDPLCVYNAEGQVIDAIPGNPSYGEEYREEYIGKTLHQLYAKEQADEFLNYIQQVVRTQQVLTVEYSEWIAGREIWFSARIAPIRHEQVIWLARDITLQKQAEAASILEERNRMAREIHDNLAQTFTGIIIHARSASNKVTVAPEKAQTLLTQILDLARSGLAEARRSVEALRRPYLLENGNLQDALRRLAAQLDSSIATQVVYEVMGTAYPLSSDLENNLFRIGQEAVTNAIKHAKAHEIRIELVYQPTQCSLRIKDDGQGFDVENQAMRNGFGLIGMTERAERIRAELKIQSHLGQGTEIVVSIDRE
jgi:PAS domain S-box-containing protein